MATDCHACEHLRCGRQPVPLLGRSWAGDVFFPNPSASVEVGLWDRAQAQGRTEVGGGEREAAFGNTNHVSWLSHLVLPLGKFLLVFCLTVSLHFLL